jgi:hypothetical protein
MSAPLSRALIYLVDRKANHPIRPQFELCDFCFPSGSVVMDVPKNTESPKPPVLQYGCRSYWGKVLVLRMRRHGRIGRQLALAVTCASNLLYQLRSLVHEILQEMGIARLRIRFRRTSMKSLQVVGFGPDLEAFPAGWVGCNRTHSRIRDKLVFDSRFPWATNPLDCLLFLQAWEMGARWGENKTRMSGMDTLVDPRDYNYLSCHEKAVQAAQEIISQSWTVKSVGLYPSL